MTFIFLSNSAPITASAATKKVVGVGKTVTYKAGATVKKITVKNKKVVKATKSKKNKKYVTLKGLKAGKTTVTIKTSKKTIKLNVCVGATKITKKTLKTTMTAGGKQTVSVTAAGGKGDTITFTSSKKSVLKVNKASAKASAKGIAKMSVAAVAEGTAKLTVASKNTGVKKAFTIKVVAATPAPATQPPTVATTPAVTGTATAVATTPAVQATATAAVPGATDATATPGTDVTATPGADVTATPGTDVTQNPDATVAPTFDPVTAKEGTLTVTTNVSGASIKVISGGATVASVSMNPLETSVTTATLQPGVYTVEITKKGYDKKTETVTIDGNKTLDVTLAEEVVLGASAAVTNSLVEYDSTVLVNQNAIVTVTVKDKDGNLVPGKTVVFSASKYDGAYAYEVKGQNVQTTDANGQASFVVGYAGTAPTESTASGYVGSAQYTAQVLNVTDGTNGTVSGCVGFAALDLGTVSLDDDSEDNLVLGSNAADADGGNYADGDGLATTKSLNGNNTVEYVSTQQVSSTGTEENALTFNVQPQIVLPAMSTDTTETKEFVQPISEEDGVSGKYSTYATTEYNHVIYLDEDTTNLEYATLIFSDVQVSEFTKLVIEAFNTDDPDNFDKAGYCVDTHTIKGEHEQKDFGYQIPVNKNVKAIRVSLKSAGQIQTDKNSGYVMTEIRGIYKSAASTGADTVDISTASVSWEAVTPTMSNLMDLDNETAIDLLHITPNDGNTTPSGAGCTTSTFKYQVPAFPNTGDAVIIEYDENSKIVAYYLAPTENNYTYKIVEGTTYGKSYSNTNEIKAIVEDKYYTDFATVNPGDPQLAALNTACHDNSYNAYKATEAEAKTAITTGVKTSGNSVTVNSETVGTTNLKGTISLPSLGGDVLDASNKYVYTSVQWNPVPEEEETTASSAFLALSGQNVTVYAQLIDKNGNPVSQADVDITYSCSDQSSTNGITFGSGSNTSKVNDIAIVKNEKTDVNGRATLVLNSADASVLDDLTASSANYKVKLYIGENTSSCADIYWVNADLEFQKDVNSAAVDRTNGTTEDAKTSIAKVGTPWEYAVRTVGNKFVLDGDGTESYEKEFKYPGTLKGYDIKIDGLKIKTTFDDDNKGKYTVVGNGVVDGTSNYEYEDVIVNSIDGSSVGNDVTFTAKNADETLTFKCVGEGTPNLNAKLNLQAGWEAKGAALSMITPLGTSISDNTVTLYVKYTDESGNNAKGGRKVYFKSNNGALSGDGTELADDGTTTLYYSTTNSDGVAEITLTKGTEKSTVVTANVNGVDSVASTTINWVDGKSDPGIVNAAMADDSTNKVVLTCNNNVTAKSVKIGMFTVKDVEGKTYEVTDATVSGKYITLTMKNELKANEYIVTVGDSKEDDGITYTLADEFGKKLDSNFTEIHFYSESKGSFSIDTPASNGDGTSRITITNVKSPVSADKTTDATDTTNYGKVDPSEADNFFEKYFKVVVDGTLVNLTSAVTTTGSNGDLKDYTFEFDVPESADATKINVYFLGNNATKTIAADESVASLSVTTKNASKVVIESTKALYKDGAELTGDVKALFDITGGGSISAVTYSSKTLTFTGSFTAADTIALADDVALTDANGAEVTFSVDLSRLDSTAPAKAASSDITVNEDGGSSASTYDAGDKITIKFSEAVKVSKLIDGTAFASGAVTDADTILGSGYTVEASSPEDGYADTFVITLAGSPSISGGTTKIEVVAGYAEDEAGNVNASAIEFTLPTL